MATERAHAGRPAGRQAQRMRPAQAGKTTGARQQAGGSDGQARQATLDRALIDWWRSLNPRTQRGYIGGLLALMATVGLVGMFAFATSGTQTNTSPLALIGAFCWRLYGWGAWPLLALIVLLGSVWVIEAAVRRALTRRWISAQALLLWLTLEAASRLYLGGATGGLTGSALAAPLALIPLWLGRALLALLIVWLTCAVIGITWAQMGMALQMGVRLGHRSARLGAQHGGRLARLTIHHTQQQAGPQLTRWRATLNARFHNVGTRSPASLAGPTSATTTMPALQAMPSALSAAKGTSGSRQPLRARSPIYAFSDLYGDMADLPPYVPMLTPQTATAGSGFVMAHTNDQAPALQPPQPLPIANAPVKKPAPPVRDDRDTSPFTSAPAIAWRLPETDLLGPLPTVDVQDQSLDVQELAVRLQETLRSFRVEAEVRPEDASVGPTVIRFGIRPIERPKRDAQGRIVYDDEGRPVLVRTRVSRILSLQDDLALALAAPSLRMEAPVPGQPYVGLEMPRPDAAPVTLRALLETPDQQAWEQMRLPLPLGSDVTGAYCAFDLATCPHLLVAGATGAGKSVCLNAFISALLMRFTPQDVRLLLIDPKMVELTAYDGAPHLLRPVLTQPDAAVDALRDALAEMERRYRLFARLGARNLDGYEQRMRQQQRLTDVSMPIETPLEPLPRIVIVIDELADLLAASGEVEGQLLRLAQLARGVGIHLIVATQRPSVDILTGALKANMPARIAFLVSSAVDSRVILDCGGAEKLLGRGDMLFLSPDAAKPRRIQGAFVGDDAVARLARFWRKQALSAAEAPLPDKKSFAPSPPLRPLPPLARRQAPTA